MSELIHTCYRIGDIDWPLISLSAALVDDDGTPEG